MIELNGETLTVEKMKRIAQGEEIQISEESKQKINKSRAIIERMIKNNEAAYGTTTGIGELADVILTPEQAEKFSRYLIYSHAAGCGKPVSKEEVRSAITSRINTLCKGMSGIRLKVAEKLVEILNKKVTPVMYPASVGACGDLAPLAQAMLVPMGEGEAYFNGKRMPGKQALEKAGVEPIKYLQRDGLAVINGSQLTAGMGALQCYESDNLIKNSEIGAAMTFESLKAVTKAFDERLLKARGYEGGIRCAENIRKMLEGTKISRSGKIQDAYSIRSTPQVTGAVKDTLKWVKSQIEIEINSGADNPLFIPDQEDGGYVAGANFQGTPIAIPLESLGIGITIIGVLSERRLNRLVNKNLNLGLPAFLIEGAGMYSGIMIPQYTAASLICQSRVLCTPAAIGSIPTAADQEDFVSMGTNTALKNNDIIDKIYSVIAIEILAAAQALELRMKIENTETSPAVMSAFKVVRKYVKFLDKDRPLYPDIEKLTEVVKSGELVREVEKVIGVLK